MKLLKFAAAAYLLGVCASSAQDLRIGVMNDLDTLDPSLSRSLPSRQVFAAMCDKLLDIDENLNFVPQLATEWAWSNGDKTLTLKLRPGVRFHDGAEMTAEDVIASLQRHLTLPGSTRKAEMGPIESIVASGPLEVRINLSKPFVPLLAVLSDRSGMIFSKAAAAEAPDAFAKKPVCAGPFKFVERVPQDRVVLERFKDYWNTKAIHFNKVTYLPIVDSTVRSVNLRSGALDLVEGVAASDVPTLKKDPSTQIFEKPSLAAAYMAINVANGDRAKTKIGQNRTVREAFSLAIDRKALNEVAFEGLFTPGNQSVAPGTPFYINSLPVLNQDLNRARALLKDAGLEQVKVQMTVPNMTDFKQAAEIIQSMVAEAGIDMELVTVETATSLKQWTDGDFESLITLWSGRTDVDGNLYNFNACGAALNGGHYCNAELDKALNEARSTSDMPTRLKHYEEAARIYLSDLPYIYLWNPTLLVGGSARIEGFKLVPDGLIRLQDVKMKS